MCYGLRRYRRFHHEQRITRDTMIISLERATDFMKDSKLTFVPRCRMSLRVAAPRTPRQHQHQHHVTFVPLLLSQPFGQLLHRVMAELEGVYSARHSILTRILKASV